MKTDTRKNIYDYIKSHFPVTINDLRLYFNISNQIIHRHINKLLDEDLVYKRGKSPKVYYFPILDENIIRDNHYEEKWEYDNIFKNYVYFWADWKYLSWIDWFKIWCKDRNIDFQKEVNFYKKTVSKYDFFKDDHGFINWIDKLKSTFWDIYLDEIYYLDFYSIEKYWKTLLWNLLLYAKQNGDKDLINEIVSKIRNPILTLISEKNIDSLAYIPPSIKRNIQLMFEIKNLLSIKLPSLNLVKIFKDKVVPQKSLSKREDRIINARDTIFILDKEFESENMLIIDDAVWSGATLNETAKKIKEKWFAKRVIWLAIVWSYKWFEVINEV